MNSDLFKNSNTDYKDDIEEKIGADVLNFGMTIKEDPVADS
jgi:hypothetical protein